MRVPYTYLTTEFAPDKPLAQAIFADIRKELERGHFTLGDWVERFEGEWAEVCGVKYAVGVNSGTDALALALCALTGNKRGGVVVTSPQTFVATAGAIVQAGHMPAFGDVGPDQNLSERGALDVFKQLAPALPVAIIPVHWAGKPVRWAARKVYSGAPVIEDACQAIGASVDGRPAGSLGTAAAFSLHPLKNINVWGDGGVVTTDDDGLAREVRLLRNHGLADRDTCVKPGVNSRLDAIQAIVGLHVLKELAWVTERRNANARRYDAGLVDVEGVTIPPRDSGIVHAYHLYVIFVSRREELIAFLTERGVEVKVHYPIPLHQQPGFKFLGYELGDLPAADRQAKRILSLPIHQFLTEEQIDFTIASIREFYGASA